MVVEASGHVGVLIVRAWHEGIDRQLRIRVTYRRDVLPASRTVATAATTADEVCGHVRTWLAMVQRT